MSRSVEKYMEKQHLILDCARNLFLDKGYRTTSMDSVAEAAGVTKQTVYRYYPSKKDLFAAVLEAMGKNKRVYEFGGGKLRDELEKYAVFFLTQHLTPERIGLYRLVVAESVHEKELGSIFFTNAQSVRQNNLAEYLENKLSSGDSEKLAGIFGSMLLHMRSGVLLGTTAIPSQQEIEDFCRFSVNVFLNGCL